MTVPLVKQLTCPNLYFSKLSLASYLVSIPNATCLVQVFCLDYFNSLTVLFQCYHWNVAWIMLQCETKFTKGKYCGVYVHQSNNQDKRLFLKLFGRKSVRWRTICLPAKSSQPPTIFHAPYQAVEAQCSCPQEADWEKQTWI